MLSALQFIDIIHKHTPLDYYIGITAIAPKSKHAITKWFKRSDLASIPPYLNQLKATHNLYVRLTALQKPPVSGRGLASDSAGSSVLWVDYDSYTSQTEGLNQLKDLNPTLINNSGYGLHGYFQLDEFCTDLNLIKSCNKRLIDDLNATTKTQTADSCYDLARILRIPQTYNLKHDQPIECKTVEYDPNRMYHISGFKKAELTKANQIDHWECEPLPPNFISDIQRRDKKLFYRITNEEKAIKKAEAELNGMGIDRSRNDAYIVTRLLSLGYSPPQALTVLTDDNWLSGAKYRETGRFDYVVTTVNNIYNYFQATPDKYFNGSNFQSDRVANELTQSQPYIYTAEHLYEYQNGVYVNNAEDRIKAQLEKQLGKYWTSFRADEVIRRITDRSRVDVDCVNQHNGLINCVNGMLNVQTGELTPHQQSYLSLTQLPIQFDPNADPTALDKFVSQILPHDAIDMFWEYVGSTFITDHYWPKAFLILVGPPDTGKSKLLEWLYRFFGGKQNVATISFQTLADHRFASADLFGVIANIFSDLDEGEAQNTGRIKALTGDDPTIYAERKFLKPFSFKNTARLFYSANNFPQIKAPDEAFFRRAKIAPTSNKFDKHNADPLVVDRLSTPNDFSAGLNRAFEGLRRLYQNKGFSFSQSVETAGNQFRFAADTVSGFLNLCEPDQNASVPKQELYFSYRQMCDADNRRAVSKEMFFRRCVEYADRFGLGEQYKLLGDRQVWCFTGRRPPQLNVLNFTSRIIGAN